jgi:DNA excision repair protein ERCC-3
VFADDVFALRSFADALKCPFIDGKTPQSQRMEILGAFKSDRTKNTVFCSKVCAVLCARSVVV